MTTEIVLGNDADMRVYELRQSPLADRAERRPGHLLVLHDITAAKQAEQELRVVAHAARAGSQAKTEFLAPMSHELRTPLNAIIGYAQLLHSDNMLPQRHRRPMRIVEQSGDHLLTLITDILDLTKIEAGADELVLADMDLKRLVDDLSAMFELRCRQKRLRWVVECDVEERWAHGDESKLRQILINLLGNAVKFTATGQVTLRVQRPKEGPCCFEVRDTGPGIPLERQEAIFEPFRQESAGLQEGGSGLGLAIARRHVELLGAELKLQSRAGEGSRFLFELELGAAHGPPPAPAAGSGTAHLAQGQVLRALVVDDVGTNRDVMTWMLQRIGVEVASAETGESAVRMARAEGPDVVFTDLRMPGLDGYGIRQQLQDMQHSDDLKVVAVSALVLGQQRQECLDMGFDGFLEKPLRVDSLYSCLVDVVGVTLEYSAEGPSAEGDPILQELTGITLPDDVRTRLMSALKAQSVSELRAEIDALPELGEGGELLAEHLRPLLVRFDLDEIRRTVEELPT